MKRLIAVLACMVMLVTFIPAAAVSAIAQEADRAEQARAVQPRASATWYEKRASSFAGGSGTMADPYLIATPEQLAHIADVSAGTNYYYSLVANINLSGYEWRPIPKFDGHLYGNGFQIQNMRVYSPVTVDGYVSMGFIGRVGATNDSTISSLVFANPEVTSASCVAVEVGVVAGLLSHGWFENVAVYDAVVGVTQAKKVTMYVGGVVGINQAELHDCSYEGTVTVNRGAEGYYIYVGGICGGNINNVVPGGIYGCSSKGSVLVDDPNRYGQAYGSYGGGIAGWSREHIADCYSSMSVTVKDRRVAVAGGLVGEIYQCSIERCYATGAVYCKATSTDYTCETSNAGGLVGETDDGYIGDCITNNSSVQSDTETGYHLTAKNYGELTTSVGRLIGMRSGTTVTNCYTSQTTTTSYVHHKRTMWQWTWNKSATHEVKSGVTDSNGTLGYTLSENFLFQTLGWDRNTNAYGVGYWIYKSGRVYPYTEDRCSLSILYTKDGKPWKAVQDYFMYGETKTVTVEPLTGYDVDVSTITVTFTNKYNYRTVNYTTHQHKYDINEEICVQRRCTICGALTYAENVNINNHPHLPERTCASDQVCTYCNRTVAEALPHTYEVLSVVAPTCEGQGYSLLRCTVCGHESKGDFTTPTGHVLGDGNVCVTCGQAWPAPIKNYDLYVYGVETGAPIEGATVTLGDRTAITDVNGMVRFQLTDEQAVAQSLTVKMTGYADHESDGYLPQATGVINLGTDGAGICEAWCNSVDVLVFKEQLNAKATDQRRATFVIKGRSKANIVKYQLLQEDKVIAESTTGEFKQIRNSNFTPGEKVVARMITDGTAGNNTFDRELLVSVIGYTTDSTLTTIFNVFSGDEIILPLGDVLGMNMDLKLPRSKNTIFDVVVGNDRLMITVGDANISDTIKKDIDKKSFGQVFKDQMNAFDMQNNPKAWGKQLGKGDCSVGFSVVALIEFDENGVTNVESRAVISMEAKYSIGKTFMVWVIPVYAQATFSFEGELDMGIVGYDYANAEFYWPGMTISAEGKMTLLGGLGCSLISAGIYGEAGLGVIYQVDKDLNSNTQGHLFGEVGLYARIKVMFFKELMYRLPLVHGDLYFPNKARVLSSSGAYDYGQYQTLSRDYLENRSEWLYGQSLSRGPGGDVGILQESAYTYIEPQMVALADGRVMMVYLDDTGDEGSNWQHLVYSLYDPVSKTWSAPLSVDGNAYCDLEFEVVSDGTDVYIVYTECGDVIDESTTDTALLNSVEVAAIRYDSVSSTFTGYHRLTNDGAGMKTLPQAAITADGVVAAWVSNPSNDVLNLGDEATGTLLSTNNHVMTAVYANGKWGSAATVAQDIPSVTTIDVGVLDGKTTIATIRDMDCDIATTEDRRMFLTDLYGTDVAVQENTIDNDGLRFVTLNGEDVLMWHNGGNLYTIDAPNAQAVAQLAAPIDTLPSDYTVVQLADNKLAVLYTVIEEHGEGIYGSNVYALFCTDGVWGEPVAMTHHTDGRYVDAFAATAKGDKVLMTYISTEVSFQEKRNGSDTVMVRSSNFMSADIDPDYNLAMGEVVYLSSDLVDKDTIELKVPVTNQSWDVVDAVRIQVADSLGNVVYTATHEYALQSGEQYYYTVPLVQANLTRGEAYTVTVFGDAREGNLTDNATQVHLWFTDFDADANLMLLGKDTQVHYSVTNEGNFGGNAKLVVFRAGNRADKTNISFKADTDTLLAEIPLGRMEVGQTLTGFVPVTDDFFAPGEDSGIVYLQVVPVEGNDLYDFNDVAAVSVQRMSSTTTETVTNPETSFTAPTVKGDNVYDLTVSDGQNNAANLVVTVEENDFAGGFVKVKELTDYSYADGKLTIPAAALQTMGEGEHVLTLVYTKGDRTVEVMVAVVLTKAYRLPTISVEDQTVVYTGNPATLQYAVLGGGAVSLSYSANGSDWLAGTPVDAGTYTIKVTVAADEQAGYVRGEAVCTLTIQKATRAVSPPRVIDYVDGKGFLLGGSSAVDLTDGQVYYGYSTVNDPLTVRGWTSKQYLPTTATHTTYYLFAKVSQSANYEDAYSAATVVDAHRHNYVATVVPPTCQSAGYTKHTCSCGDSYTDSLTTPSFHEMGELVITKQPGHHTDGEGYRQCIYCDYTEYQLIPGLDTFNGDVNDDGDINNRDVAALQRYLNGWNVSVHEQAADIDNNGRINNRDLGLLLRYLNDMIELPQDE